jgi:hypothetical protein
LLRFLLYLLLATIVICGSVYIGASQQYFEKPSFFVTTLLLLFLITTIIFLYLYNTEKPQSFLQLYLFTMVLKLILYCVYNFIMVTKQPKAAVANVVFFMATYFVFTAIEIALLYRKVGADSRR